MSTSSDDGSVNSSIGNGAVNAVSATGGVTAEMKSELQRIVAGMMKDLVPRAVKTAVAEVVPSALQQAMEGVIPKTSETSQAQPGGNDAANGEQRLTMKALLERIESQDKQIKATEKARLEAEARAEDSRMRSEIRDRFAAKMGADHPMLGTVMDSLYDVKKRFAKGPDGKYAVKFPTQWGDEELKPLDEGVSSLFDGELKHLVQQSKAGQLPPANFRGLNGTRLEQTKPQAGQYFDPLKQLVGETIGATRPELGNAIVQSAYVDPSKK